MSGQPRVQPDPALELLEVYDSALPHVHGYLLSRCRDRTLAQDLTAETFLAAVSAARWRPGNPDQPQITTGWLIGVARHKLADHWRRVEREQRGLRLIHTTSDEINDPWDVEIDTVVAHQVLDALGAPLTLRYLDGLPVAQVAEHLGRTVHATEALLVRARAAFRSAYEDPEGVR